MTNTNLSNKQMQQQIHQNLHQAVNNLHAIGIDLLLIGFVVGFFVCVILYLCSLKKTMRCVPSDKRIFPNWFIWMMVIPVIGYVFTWLMLPFGIPHGLRNIAVNNKDALRETVYLKVLGLVTVILPPFIIFMQAIFKDFGEATSSVSVFTGALLFLSVVLYLVSIITYWIRTVSFRKKYFNV